MNGTSSATSEGSEKAVKKASVVVQIDGEDRSLLAVNEDRSRQIGRQAALFQQPPMLKSTTRGGRGARPMIMDQDRIEFFKDVIVTKYKSFDNPDFAFVKRGFASRPYEPVVKRLRDYAAVEELTEADDDVCFSYFLKGRAALWKLDLSLVGPFGIFVRLKNKVDRDDFLFPARSDLVDFEVKMIDILKASGIRFLTADDLTLKLPMTLFNTAKDATCVYQALFSDRPNLPWE